MAEVIKSLKVKTGTVTRVHKELNMYQKEQAKELARVEKMKSENAEFHDIKQAENVLHEAEMMIPETQQRLEAAFADIQSYLADNLTDIPEGAELQAAKEIISLVQTTLQ
mmetsp:Transcript_4437/g.7371  ORF Transcript_4437/g.7371 Transcript_4437/m.7371 type:complete len:110 (+) Transcript_4437:121-450(+)|eukprot:CAMPEP_0119104280 /NCGR_PEP_ID=MMETSP1180-20130426/2526_1 /TAXON_ID=3052 ORGANISM="Chlamydomonas cf sp, Strain CCMP681" /NCGR_SAMPLE_ID=MMETSP1180 /ASSEMBLY_ACC=CAM_ASM_000741 /LENGTH=109 /DNA_ID=CAMNT_0007088985 /DNA_START=114 /DNA_END=443 /DNA_ORIENTATION=-